MNDLSCRFTQWWTRCSGGCEALESAAELKHKRLKSEVCICVCGRTLECGSPCLFHLLLGECWHLFAMCVMWMRIFVSIVWLAGGRGALLGVVKHNKCRGGGLASRWYMHVCIGIQMRHVWVGHAGFKRRFNWQQLANHRSCLPPPPPKPSDSSGPISLLLSVSIIKNHLFLVGCGLSPSSVPSCPLRALSASEPLTNECQSGGLWHFYCRHLPWQTQGFSQHESCEWTPAKVTAMPSTDKPLARFLPGLLKVWLWIRELLFVFPFDAFLLLEV